MQQQEKEKEEKKKEEVIHSKFKSFFDYILSININSITPIQSIQFLLIIQDKLKQLIKINKWIYYVCLFLPPF